MNQLGSVTVNKRIVDLYGTDTAVVFGELLSRYRYFADKGKLDGSGFFFNSMRDLKGGTGLGKKPQRKAIQVLVDAGLIEMMHYNGQPRRFRIKLTATIELLNRDPKGTGIDRNRDPKGTATETQRDPLPGPKGSPNNYKGNNYKEEVQDCVHFYNQLFKEHVGHTVNVNPGKKFIEVVEQHGPDKTKKMLKQYFDTADDFIRNSGYSLNIFPGQIQKFLVEQPKPKAHMTRREQIAAGMIKE